MSTSYRARAPRQAAVLAAIAGLHAAAFVLIIAGLGPRLPTTNPPEWVLVFRPPPPPVPLEPAPRMPGPVDHALPPLTMPQVQWPTFVEPADPVVPGADRPTGIAGRGPDLPAQELRAPRLKPRDGRLAALVETCYPAASRRQGEEGRVVVRLDVDAAGRVGAWNYVERSGFQRIDDAVECVVRRLEFHPGRRDGKAVSASVHLPVVFRLR